MTWTCSTCDATIAGSRAEHCGACHETFTSTTSGDMHRTGKHGQITGPARRRCLTEAEMLDRGMTRNRSGQWTTGLVDTRWNAAHCSHVATQDGLKPLDPYSDTPNILKGPQKS